MIAFAVMVMRHQGTEASRHQGKGKRACPTDTNVLEYKEEMRGFVRAGRPYHWGISFFVMKGMMQLSRSMMRRGDHFFARRGGFTLIEVMVTVIVLGILVSMVATRFHGDLRRRRDLFAARINSVLETLAFRQQIGQSRIALTWDGERRSLTLERLFRESETDERAEWQRDLLTKEVLFDDPEIQISRIRFNGESIDLGRFIRREIPLDEIRPAIEIEMNWGENVDLFQLLSYGSKPIRYGMGLTSPANDNLEPIDLDDVGRGDQSW